MMDVWCMTVSKMTLLFTALLITSLVNAHSEPCLEYGCPGRPQYEPFVPAPPGHTPNCAKPGQTFCESLDHYPRQLIKFLVDKCNFNFNSVLRDESRDNFNVYRSIPNYSEGYDYPPAQGEGQFHSLPFLPPPAQYPVQGQPALIYGTLPNDTQQNGYTYTTPTQRNPFLGDGTTPIKYHSTEQRVAPDRPFYPQPQTLHSFQQGHDWWGNRPSRNDRVAPRSLFENPLLKYSKLSKERKKRQSDTIPLCPTESQYITPRAALNNQGNWMYVVNLSDQNQKYSQVVKSERCTTDVCNGICSVPAGYTSRCQQQYVQKRLVALEGSGNQLYTDVFWFPHGCSCQIMGNF
ncbi:protein spaetzle 5 [Ceratina calcarata]|uniref:Protein spaetzle 5 n=1 Tax=Ceratina calcarata TaxID=156304 RepID=A0AAJ7JB49_9HYME|nr:protein spaetzle 5 [Ceratina calcarata]